jgi:hypothetical protein
MKSKEEMILSLDDMFITNKAARGLAYYGMKPTGNILKDFATFTDLQCLKPSYDPNDYYIKNGGHYSPKPDKSGKAPHTVRDVTYDLFHTFCPQFFPEQFNEMSDETKMFIVKNVIKSAIITNSDAINYLFGYCLWATGNYKKELAFYKEWYGTKLQDDIDTLDELTVFIRLIDIRVFRMAQSNMPGHLGGILCFYKVFVSYCK